MCMRTENASLFAISIVSNFHLGKRLVARDMTISRFHVDTHVPNIGYMKVYDGIWRYMTLYGSMVYI